MISEEKIRSCISDVYSEIISIRRDIHQHPELSEREERTEQVISTWLSRWGIPHTTGVAGHGVVGVIQGKAAPQPAPKYEAVAIRADIDALPIQEAVASDFASCNPGVMHACGHDIHTAMLLGTAKILKSLENEFSGAVKLFFQPSEETIGGANQMIQAGCMQQPNVGAVLGFHVAPACPTGSIQFCRGKMNAATCDLLIDVEGVSCHGAHPEGGVDAIVAASQIVTALQSIPSRNLAPTDAGIITIGTFHAGTKANILAGSASLCGTMRALDPETMAVLKKRSRQISEDIAAGYGATAHVTQIDGYPALINSEFLFEQIEPLAEKLVGRENISYMDAPSLGADDFAFFCQACDSLYMNLGVNSGREEQNQKLHSEYFNPDENAMKTGILMEVMGVLTLLDLPADAKQGKQ